ncbi:MAG TPA: tetratricopeptide repeat protein [Gammaproteobacteria bacterium]|nr:tetratricopeptide repeat protein [Gammaproteobacteria bacterium]
MLRVKRLFNRNFPLLLLLIVPLFVTGCAGMSWNKKDSEYDFFMENSKGEKPANLVDLESDQIEGNKEAKLKAQNALNQGDIDAALYYYVKALDYDPEDAESLITIGDIHTKRGNIELAMLAYQMVLNEDASNLEAQIGMGLSLIRINKYEQARFILLRALKDNPQRPRIYNALGVISDIDHIFSEARWFYANALKMAPDSPVTQTNIAYSYFLSNEWDKAEKIYKKVLRRYPKHAQASLNYGLLLARKGRLLDAQFQFENVLDKSKAYNELGYILMLDKKYVMAEQLFQKAISASPVYFKRAYKNMERLRELKDRQSSRSAGL